MILRRLAIGMMALSTVALVSCGGNKDEESPETGVPVKVSVLTVEAAMEPNQMSLPGELVSTNRFEVASKITGRVLELPVAEGDRVKRGDLLLRLDAPELVFAAEAARAGENAARIHRETATRQAERFRRLAEGKVVTPRDLDLAELDEANAIAMYEEAKAAGKMSQSNLSYASVRAPMDGIVVRRPARLGDLAAPGQVLLVLDDANAREVRVTFAAHLSSEVKPGGVAEVRYADEIAAAVVDRVSPGASGQTMEAFLRVEGLAAPTGSFVDAVLRSDAAVPTVRVPQNSLIRRGPLTGVFTVREGRAVLRWLRLAEDGRVLSGLASGDVLVLSPPADLQDGMTVETAP